MPFWERERVTLVIEHEVVRLMGVHRGQVTRWGSAPLPRGAVQDGAVGDLSALAQVIERLWQSQTQRSPAPRDNIVVAVPGYHLPTRLVSAPDLDPRDRRAIQAAARAALPDEEAYHAAQLVGPPTQPGLFVVAAPAPLVDGYVEALHRAGLGVAAMDTKPLALIRAVGQRHAVIVDGERARGSILVVEEALPRLARFPALAAPLLAAPEDKIMRLAETLYQTIQQLHGGESGSALHPATPFYLTGSLADHGLLRDIVQEVFGYTVGHYTPPITLPPDLPVSQFMTNLGLVQKRL